MYVPSTSISEIVDSIDSFPLRENESLGVFIAERDHSVAQDFANALIKSQLPFFGALAPHVLSGGRHLDSGLLLVAWPTLGIPSIVLGLDTRSPEVPADFGRAVRSSRKGSTSLFLLTDGLAKYSTTFLREVYARIGHNVHYFGGGAGSLTLDQKPCVFTRDGIFENAALAVFIDTPTSVHASHGWTRVGEPLVATRTAGNRIIELNWEPALAIYRERVYQHFGVRIERDPFGTIAKNFPFGIRRNGTEDLIRDPLAVTKDGVILCAGETPENSVLYITHASHDGLLRAAKDSAEGAIRRCSNPASTGFVIDCVSRALVLEDRFASEIDEIYHSFARSGFEPPEGILSIGEIASHGSGYPEFFNKTVVTTVFHAK